MVGAHDVRWRSRRVVTVMEMVVGGGVCLYLSLQVGPGPLEFQWT